MTTSNAESLFDLVGKVAIVTGAARGNGKAIAEGLAESGASVMMVDILKSDLVTAAQAISKGGKQVSSLPADIRKLSDLRRIVRKTMAAFGSIDILVNCAGVAAAGSSDEYGDKMWRFVFDVNTTAAFRLCKLVAPHMIKKNGGAIINVTSIASGLGFPSDPAYPASKAALQQLTRGLATDWAKHNIRVNNLCPGYFRTAMTARSWSDPIKKARRSNRCMMRRWGDPKELVGPVIFLASRASSFMTGSDLYIDGGLSKTGFAEDQN